MASTARRHNTTPQKSKEMAAIRTRNTGPELRVRRYLHRNGFRYRLHGDLPGKPDIVFPKYRCVVFVHGCFWHGHGGCSKARLPQTNKDFWAKKQSSNAKRDTVVRALLAAEGWRVITAWECETKQSSYLNALAEAIRTYVRLD